MKLSFRIYAVHVSESKHFTKSEVFHPHETADLVTLTEEILNRKRHFLYSKRFKIRYNILKRLFFVQFAELINKMITFIRFLEVFAIFTLHKK